MFYAGEFYTYPLEKINEIQKPYKERIEMSEMIVYSCTMISKQFSKVLSIDLDVSKIDDLEYVRNCILKPQATDNLFISWLAPIWDSLNK